MALCREKRWYQNQIYRGKTEKEGLQVTRFQEKGKGGKGDVDKKLPPQTPGREKKKNYMHKKQPPGEKKTTIKRIS